MGLGDVTQGIVGGAPGAIQTVFIVLIIAVIIVVVLGSIFAVVYFKRKWNLKVEIKLTRGDGKITHGEWGKGQYRPKQGVIMIKRDFKKAKPIAIPIMDIRRYMQGVDLITVIQVGPEDYRPVLNRSWSEYECEYEDTTKPLKDDKGNLLIGEDGKQMYDVKIIKEAIINIKTDTGRNKAWRVAWESAANQAYTIQGFLTQYQTPIAIGIVVICCFVGFAVLWSKI